MPSAVRGFLVELPTGERRTLRAASKDSLRDALVRQRVPHPNVCGGSSICGTCWVQVIEGQVGPPAPDEARLLAHFAPDVEGHRLACRLTLDEAEGAVVRLRAALSSTVDGP